MEPTPFRVLTTNSEDVPAKDFWTLVVYDLESKSYAFNELNRGGLSFYDKANMKMNADGSVNLYCHSKPRQVIRGAGNFRSEQRSTVKYLAALVDPAIDSEFTWHSCRWKDTCF
jgi:Protein of unknown function (DUF1214)